MVDPRLDELIRQIANPGAEDHEAEAEARERLRAAIGTAEAAPTKRGRRLRGFAVVLALVLVPTGVAVATELTGEDLPEYTQLADCTELSAAAEERGLSSYGLVLDGCPESSDIDSILTELARIQGAYAEDSDARAEETLIVISKRDGGEEYGLWGIAGETETEQQP